MIEDCFTSQSIERNPVYLRKIYNQKLINSLLNLVEMAAQGLKGDYSKLKSMIAALNVEEKLSQQLYGLNAILLICLKCNNFLEVSRAFQSLCLIIENYPYASFSIRTITSEPWELSFLQSQKEPTRNSQGKTATIDCVEKDSLNKYSSIIMESLKLLKTTSPSFYEEFETYISEIILFKSDRIVGMTDSKLFGSIYLSIPHENIPPDVHFCENIIHETSHLHLDALLLLDPIIENDPNERYTAPIRPDPRPMLGIFHATFVLSRMVRMFHQLVILFNNASYKERLNILQKQFMDGYAMVKTHANLTHLGQKIVDSYCDLLEYKE